MSTFATLIDGAWMSPDALFPCPWSGPLPAWGVLRDGSLSTAQEPDAMSASSPDLLPTPKTPTGGQRLGHDAVKSDGRTWYRPSGQKAEVSIYDLPRLLALSNGRQP